MTVKPVFKKREVVLADPQKSMTDLGGGKKEVVGTVEYVGEEQSYYKPGDKVLINLSAGTDQRTIKYFGKDLIKFEDERGIICQIVEDASV